MSVGFLVQSVRTIKPPHGWMVPCDVNSRPPAEPCRTVRIPAQMRTVPSAWGLVYRVGFSRRSVQPDWLLNVISRILYAMTTSGSGDTEITGPTFTDDELDVISQAMGGLSDQHWITQLPGFDNALGRLRDSSGINKPVQLTPDEWEAVFEAMYRLPHLHRLRKLVPYDSAWLKVRNARSETRWPNTLPPSDADLSTRTRPDHRPSRG